MYQVLSLPLIGDISPLKFNAILACIAGFFFFSGWWIMIALISENIVNIYEFLPGLFATVALVIVNLIPTSFIRQPSLYLTETSCCCGSLMCKIYLFIGFMVSFGSLIGACYILINDYLLNRQELNKWPGYGVLLQNLMIFIATVFLKCTVSKENF